jgi:Type II secretion system (T2SS), protein E, N-terminal domain
VLLAAQLAVEVVHRRGELLAAQLDGAERIRWRRRFERPARTDGAGDTDGDDVPGEIQLTVNAEAEIEFTDLIGSIEPVDSIDPFRPNDQPTAPRTKADDDDGWGSESPWSARDTEYLLQSLVGKGVLSPRMARSFAATIDWARGITAERRLVDAGILSEEEMLAEYCAVNGSEFVCLAACDIDLSVASAIPVEIGLEFGLIAIGRHGDMTTVALSDPQNERALAAVYRNLDAPTYFVMATRADVLAAYERLAAT